MKALPIAAASLALLTACAGMQKENNYYVEANMGPDFNGQTA